MRCGFKGTNNTQAKVISMEKTPTTMLKKGKTSLLKHKEARTDVKSVTSPRHAVP
jgi:hypothetical protein